MFTDRLATIQIGFIRYNSPTTQICLLGGVFFCTVGMFSAVSNLGAGGTQDVALVDIANSVLYALFSIGGIVAGGAHNLLGPRLTLLIGSLGYSLYIGGLWCHQTTGNRWFVILAGAVLGMCAALLWAAQGAIMMSLPMEKDKGRAFAVFWSIFQMGSVVGGIISFAVNFHSTLPVLSTGIYLAFMIIMFVGTALALLALPGHKIVREDGSVVAIVKQPTVREEVMGMWAVMKDWRILALFPSFFASNYFYAYQGALNAHIFNARKRSLVDLLSGAGAVVGAIIIGLLLDLLPFKRRIRGFLGMGIVAAIGIATWGGGLDYQLTFTRATPSPLLDWTHSGAAGPIVLWAMYYVFDAVYQDWSIGGLSNDVWRLARCAGMYKAIQSAGQAGSFGMDANKTPYLNEHLASAIMCMLGLIPMCYVIASLRDTNLDIEPETLVEDVVDLSVAVPQGHHVGHLHHEENHEAHIDLKDGVEVFDRQV